MISSLVAMMLYDPTPLKIPNGVTTELRAPGWYPSPYQRPTTIGIARNGTVASVVSVIRGDHSVEKIMLIRPNGRTSLVDPPSDSVLATNFFAYLPGNDGRHTYPNAHIQSISLKDDGALFVTMANEFSGAFGGTEIGSYLWDGGSWLLAAPRGVGSDNRNVWLAAAGTTTAFEVDSLASGPPYGPYQVLTGLPDAKRIIGDGVAMSVRGMFIAGYEPDFGASQHTVAISWSGQKRTVLGQGVAWAVNEQGLVVGDDRSDSKSIGHPVVWKHGRSLMLDKHQGSCYAVSDSGIVIGESSDGGFLADTSAHPSKAILLDLVLARPHWHIAAGYGIDGGGTILALASRNGGEPELTLLRPSATRRNHTRRHGSRANATSSR